MHWHSITLERVRVFPIKLSRLISLVGALVLFTTFLVKEELRDHQKDLLADIQAAQAQYAEDQRAEGIVNTIETLEFIGRTEGIDESPYDPQSPVQAKMRLVSDFRTLSESGESYRNAQSLKSALPNDAAIEKTQQAVEAIRKNIGAAMQEVSTVQKLPNDMRLTQIQSSAVEQLHQVTFQISQATPAFVDKVLTKAAQEEKARRESYERWTRLSYFLYPIGWVLTFCGGLLWPEKKEAELAPE
jgi:hypothetical protein